MNKNFFIKTYGCQMNAYDSDQITALLIGEGWAEQDSPEAADLIILNTCHIRRKAAEKIYSEIGRLKKLKAKAHPPLIAIAGCVAQAEGEAMRKNQPEIDLIFGPQSFHRLPQMIKLAKKGQPAVITEFFTQEKFLYLKQMRNKSPAQKQAVSAFLSVQEGCDKFCAFCVVPYTRGSEVSRPPADILAEAKALIKKGAREIILLGQNVNAYQAEGWGLADLLEALAELSHVRRLRYTTSHPLDMDARLIAAHRDNPKLMPFIHLPAQSGSDRILKKMNRRHAARDYLDIIARLREARPDIALSSDFIVGFPEESDSDFADTLTLVEAIGFAQAYSFKYSPRSGTPACERPQIDEAVKTKRLAELNRLLNQQQADFHQSCIGRKMEILIEQPGFGKTCYGQHAHLDRAAPIGAVVEAHIVHAGAHSLRGEIL